MGYLSYRDLDIYKKAHKLAIEIHEMSLKLPKFELYEEGRQIRKSSKSVSSNIAEGFGRRRYKQEFVRFLIYYLASCDETREHLDTLYETKSLNDKERHTYFCEEYDHLGRMIVNFTKFVESGHKTKNKEPISSIESHVSSIEYE